MKPAPGRVGTLANARSYSLSRDSNDAFRAVNRMVAAGERVRVAEAFYFDARPATTRRLESIAQDLGVSFQGLAADLGPRAVGPWRIGLWDQYGGSMPSGWTRWILEQFEFPFSRVFAPELDAGNLNAKFDSLIFVDGAIPAAAEPGAGRGGGRGGGGRGAGPQLGPNDVPAEYRTHVGRMTAEQTIPRLREFVEAGGTLIAIGSSAENIVRHFGLPLENHLVEEGKPLPRAKYFVPGSVLTAKVDTRHPVAAGMAERTDFFFDNSPVFRSTDASKRQRPPDCRVRFGRAAQERMGVGPALPEGRRRRRGGHRRKGARLPVRPRDPPARAASRDVQAVVQCALGRAEASSPKGARCGGGRNG